MSSESVQNTWALLQELIKHFTQNLLVILLNRGSSKGNKGSDDRKEFSFERQSRFSSDTWHHVLCMFTGA